MAKGKVSKGKNYISAGTVGKDERILKSVRSSRNSIQRYLNAFESWKRGSAPGKILQKHLNISKTLSYNEWNKTTQFRM